MTFIDIFFIFFRIENLIHIIVLDFNCLNLTELEDIYLIELLLFVGITFHLLFSVNF
jgi:hypothetical protein